ncbi:MAG TPA: hypothetical protein DCS93_12255 [Microscillaceae bacterium]|nr:hypothetical protein [Microscillaceae bacterium]
MKITLYTLAIIGWLTHPTIAQGIKFEKGSWAEIKTKAKAENKHIFVDAYTTWCGPCKWQSQKVFPQKEVGDFFNKRFVSFKLDMEKGEGPAFAKKYKVSAYPTLLYFNPQGEVVHKIAGAAPANILLKLTADALNPETQVFTLQRRFEKGEKNDEFLEKYIKALKAAFEDIAEPVKLYLSQLGKDQWATTKGWKFISQYVEKPSAEAFEYVLKNQAKFEQVAKKKKSVKNYIEKVLEVDMKKVAFSKNKSEAQLDSLKQRLKEVFTEKKDVEKLLAKADFWFFYLDKDKEKAFRYVLKYYDNYCDDAADLGGMAARYSIITSDPKKLEKALAWAEKSVRLKKTWYNTSTQARLLYKLKRYLEAKKVAEESLALSKKIGGDLGQTQALLEKISAKL